MAVAKMEKINIVGIQEDKEKILKKLQQMGCAEIIEPNKELLARVLGENVYFTGKGQMEFDIAEIKFAIDFLNRYDTKNKPGMIQGFMGDLPKIDKSEFAKRIKTDYMAFVKDIKQIESQMLTIEREKEKIKQQLELLRDWSNLKIPISQLKSLGNYQFILGSILIDKWPEFSKKLADITELTSVEKILSLDTNSRLQKFLLIFPQKPEELSKKINQLLNELNFQSAEYLTKYEGKIDDEIKNLKLEGKRIREQKKQLEAKIKSYFPQKLNLMCIYDYLSWKENLSETQQKTISTNNTFILNAWVRVDTLDKVKNELSNITKNISLSILKLEEKEQPPVILKNNKFIKPFEAVTNIYGMPKYDEPDPTTWLAPFFILFFALCLTDAGYGLIIIIVTYLMLKKWDYLLIRLLNYAGWATLFVGALTGGWFGIELDTFKWTWLADKLKYIRIVDPVKSPMTIMILALGLGLLQIWFGIACKMYWNIVSGRTKDALLDELPWLYFLIVLIGFALAKMGVLPAAQIGTWQILLYIGLIVLVFTQGRKQKNIFMKLPSGILSLYDAVGFLSDTLSYTRLLALGLATAIIAFVVNMIASLTLGIPAVGWLLFAIILIGGHTFNLAINMLGSFIHSGRLQYVEFFSKFMEGGGRRFKPFSRNNIYINIR